METRKNIVAQFLAPYKISLMESSLPPLLPEYAVIEYLYCGICGGDYSVYLGRRQAYPISLGHEFVGRIISVGKNVTNLKNGQYVISDLNYRCGECKFCKRGQSHLCEKTILVFFPIGALQSMQIFMLAISRLLPRQTIYQEHVSLSRSLALFMHVTTQKYMMECAYW